MSVSELRVPREDGPSGLVAASKHHLHARGVLRDRLITEFPSVAPERIGALVDAAYARTTSARIQAFRILLAERDVRAPLRDL